MILVKTKFFLALIWNWKLKILARFVFEFHKTIIAQWFPSCQHLQYYLAMKFKGIQRLKMELDSKFRFLCLYLSSKSTLKIRKFLNEFSMRYGRKIWFTTWWELNQRDNKIDPWQKNIMNGLVDCSHILM